MDKYEDYKDMIPDWVKGEEDFELYKMRHSAEHVLTQAMINLYGEDKIVFAMGPAIKDGFYFDFEPVGIDITEEMFKEIEKEMEKIVKADMKFERKEVGLDEAKKIFKNNPYKLEWLDEIEDRNEKISLYYTEDKFVDLCKGPHVDSTKQIGKFKLLSIAGAYWHGDEKNKMLTRIYGTTFGTKDELMKHLKMLKEAKERNHRKIGKEMELFTIIPEIGKGLPVWLPNGYAIRRALEDYMIKFERKYDYVHILTPNIYKSDLFKTSGHLDFYKDSMYSPIEIDDEEFYLKPMNCPAGMMVYKMKPRSYRELPMKVGEFGTVYRYEKSGELHGLQRVRGFTQNDAHIFCTEEQLEGAFMEVVEMLDIFYKDLGFTNYKFYLATSDPEAEKFNFCGTRQEWEAAEDAMREVLQKNKIDFEEDPGEAAFYGPKLDIKGVNVFGKEDTISTIQVDFNLPERFDLKYIDSNNEEKRPFVIHRALIGSFERFFAFLIEYYGGKFPLWLAPEQVAIIPISEKQNKYSKEIKNLLLDKGVRVLMDERDIKMQAKIRDAQAQKIPYMLIVGGKEEEARQVSVRYRDEKENKIMKLDDFILKLNKKIEMKDLDIHFE